MLATQPLSSYLRSEEHTVLCNKPSSSSWCLACELSTLAKQAEEAGSRGGYVSPTSIVRNLRKIAHGLSPGRQEDSQELYLAMVDVLEGVMLHQYGGKARYPDVRTRETTLLGHIFMGYIRYQTICTKCGHISQRFDTKVELEVDMSARAGTSLSTALTALFADEQLDEDNQYACSSCKQRVCATRRSRLEVAPNVLVLCFKRFGMGRFSKISRKMTYGTTLDLGPYRADDAIDGSPATYSLYGVLVHHGASSMFGHYTAYTKVGGRWYSCDDSSVEEVEEKEALGQSAYMLFYMRDTPRAAPDPALKLQLQKLGRQASRAAGDQAAGLSEHTSDSIAAGRAETPSASFAGISIHGEDVGRLTSPSWRIIRSGSQAASTTGSGTAAASSEGGAVAAANGGTPEAAATPNGTVDGAAAGPWQQSTLVLTVDVPGVADPEAIEQLHVQGRELLLYIPGQYLLTLTIPRVSGSSGEAFSTQQQVHASSPDEHATGQVQRQQQDVAQELDAGWQVSEVRFKRKQQQLKIVLQPLMIP